MSDNQINVSTEMFITRDNKLLLGIRKNCFGAGTWSLPGGHLEYKETLKQCAVRELKEELGIIINEDELRQVLIVDDVKRQDTHYVHVGFHLKDYKGEYILMEPDRCEEWKWFPIEKLPENIFIGHKEEIKRFVEEVGHLKLET